jgi:pilus assembly protein Flp/PilA
MTLQIRFVRDDKGQDLIEYALLAAGIALAAALAVGLVGTALNGWYSGVSTSVSNFPVG